MIGSAKQSLKRSISFIKATDVFLQMSSFRYITYSKSFFKSATGLPRIRYSSKNRFLLAFLLANSAAFLRFSLQDPYKSITSARFFLVANCFTSPTSLPRQKTYRHIIFKNLLFANTHVSLQEAHITYDKKMPTSTSLQETH